VERLSDLTTLRLGGEPARMVEAGSEGELAELVRSAYEPLLVLAGGSNVVVADGGFPGVEMLRIAEPTRFDTYVAVKRGAVLSPHMEHFIHCLRTEMRSLGREREKPRRQQPRRGKKTSGQGRKAVNS